jgi:hypothetical protein
MGVDQIQSGKRPGQFQFFRAVERSAAMVGHGWHGQRQKNSDDEHNANHAHSSWFLIHRMIGPWRSGW